MSSLQRKLGSSHHGGSSPANMADDSGDPVLGDESIETEITTGEPTQEVSQDVGMTNGEDANAPAAEESQNEGSFEPRIPAKKDATLKEFLGKMDEYAPIVYLTFRITIRSPS